MPNQGFCRKSKQVQRDAEQILRRLKAKEATVAQLAQQYHLGAQTFKNAMIAAVSMERWRRCVRQSGPKPGNCKPWGDTIKPEIDAKHEGPACWYCSKPITPDTRVCGYCGTLLPG